MNELEQLLESVPKFNLAGFTLERQLNHGACGVTYLASKQEEKIVIKEFYHPNDELTDINELIVREIHNLSFCRHNQLVIRFRGISFTDLNGNHVEYPLLIQDFAVNGSLGDLIKRKKSNNEHISDVDKMIFIYGIAKSMQYLHNFNIIFRDLKPDNILLDQFFNPVLSDFGTSRTIVTTRMEEITPLGTPLYSAPEIFEDSLMENYSMQSDVFSFGMLMYTLLAEKIPYEDLSNPTIFSIAHFLQNRNRLPLPNSIPNCFKQLIELTWHQEQRERPSFSQIVELFDAGIILPQVLQNEEYKQKYFQYTQMVSNSGVFDKSNLVNLRSKLKDIDNKPKLAAIVSFFLADFFNDAEYQTSIGRHLINGIVLDTNRRLGIDYLMRAAQQNQKEALFYLGQCYENGIELEANSEQALNYFNRSAQLGFQSAINYIHRIEEFAEVSKENAPEVIIIGSISSGKTTFTNKMINIYNNSETEPTIAINDYFLPCIDKNNEKFFIKIRDTQGMEQFAPLLPNFCRSAKLALVMFDVNNQRSFDDIDRWIRQLRQYNDNAKLMIIANKIDLEWTVLSEDAIEKARNYNAKYIEVSALKGINVENVAKKIINTIRKNNVEQVNAQQTINIVNQNESNQKKKCC